MKQYDPVETTLCWLRQNYSVFRKNLPLAIGIRQAILDQKPPVGENDLAAALERHTGGEAYLRALSEPGAMRFNLWMTAVSEVSDDDRQYALLRLRTLELEEAEEQVDELTRRLAEAECRIHSLEQELADRD